MDLGIAGNNGVKAVPAPQALNSLRQVNANCKLHEPRQRL